MAIPDGTHLVFIPVRFQGSNDFVDCEVIVKNGEAKMVWEWARFSRNEPEFPTIYIFLKPYLLTPGSLGAAKYSYPEQIDVDRFLRESGEKP